MTECPKCLQEKRGRAIQMKKTAPIKIFFISFISFSKPLTPGSTKTFHYRMTHSCATIYTCCNVHRSRTNRWAVKRELSIIHNKRSITKQNPFYIPEEDCITGTRPTKISNKASRSRSKPKRYYKRFHYINVIQSQYKTHYSTWQMLHK